MSGILPYQHIVDLAINPPKGTKALISPVPDEGTQAFNDLFQPASCDLTVGRIFTAEGGDTQTSVTLKPGELATVLTEEILSLPGDIAAFAYPPNFLSQRGVLVLNPGHVDPGFHGRLTIRLINVRKSNFVLRKGQSIFTVVFERVAAETDRLFDRNEDDAKRIQNTAQMVQDTMTQSLFDLHATHLRETLELEFRASYVKIDDLPRLWVKKMWIWIVAILGAWVLFDRTGLLGVILNVIGVVTGDPAGGVISDTTSTGGVN